MATSTMVCSDQTLYQFVAALEWSIVNCGFAAHNIQVNNHD
jgi:hypothetical protein